MMRLFDNELKVESKNKGYRPEMVEKVFHLLSLLDEFMNVPFLSDRLVLKGGTAINFFCNEEFPRLSVDIDLNYIGELHKDAMQKDRLEVEKILLSICEQRQYSVHRNPNKHAGGKTVLTYNSFTNNKGRLEIDLNYLYRIPLWKPEWRKSPSWPKATQCKVLDIHEIAAGKLNALFERHVSRDLFDSHQLLTKWPLDIEKLRLAFTIYASMRKQSWQNININNLNFSVKDIRDKLIPVLNKNVEPQNYGAVQDWASNLLNECKEALQIILPFRKNEIEFLETVQKNSVIKPDLLTDDQELRERIQQHPLINWRVQQNLLS